MEPRVRLYLFLLIATNILWACGKPRSIDPAAAALQAETTSELVDARGRYTAAKLTDGTLASWCEGVPGNGEGQKITLRFSEKATGKHAQVRLQTLYIRNGYGEAKNYLANGRAWKLTARAGRWTSNPQLRDTATPQEIKFPEALETDSIELTIDSVYPGARDSDTCISEISIVPMQGTLAAPVIEKFSEMAVQFSSGRHLRLNADNSVTGDLCFGCQLSQPVVSGSWKAEPGIIRIVLTYKKSSDGCASPDGARCSESTQDLDIVLSQVSPAGVTDTEGNSGSVSEWKN